MSHSRGFTLIEVMAVIAFIGIMTAITFVSFSGRRDDEALKAAAREVATVVRAAQSNALAGMKEPGNDNGLCSNEVRWKDGSTYETYIVQLKDGNTSRLCGVNTDEKDFLLDSHVLSSGVTFSSNWSTVSFNVPRGDLDGGAVQSIVLSKSGKSIAVCVLASGSVVEMSVGISTCP